MGTVNSVIIGLNSSSTPYTSFGQWQWHWVQSSVNEILWNLNLPKNYDTNTKVALQRNLWPICTLLLKSQSWCEEIKVKLTQPSATLWEFLEIISAQPMQLRRKKAQIQDSLGSPKDFAAKINTPTQLPCSSPVCKELPDAVLHCHGARPVPPTWKCFSQQMHRNRKKQQELCLPSV